MRKRKECSIYFATVPVVLFKLWLARIPWRNATNPSFYLFPYLEGALLRGGSWFFFLPPMLSKPQSGIFTTKTLYNIFLIAVKTYVRHIFYTKVVFDACKFVMHSLFIYLIFFHIPLIAYISYVSIKNIINTITLSFSYLLTTAKRPFVSRVD